MRIGLDYRSGLHGRGGIAVYARELATALAAGSDEDSVHLYAKQWRRRTAPAQLAGVPAPQGAQITRGRLPARALPWLARVGWGADRLLGGVDVLHLLDYARLPVSRAPVVATIHDVLFERLPTCYTDAMLTGLRATTKRLVAEAVRIITPSERSARDLQTHYNVAPEQVVVVAHGAPRVLPQAPRAEPDGAGVRPYVFFPGTLEPRKNHVRLIEAFARLAKTHPDTELRLAGARGWMDEAILRAVERTPRVRYLGPLPAAAWAEQLAGARAVVYPSLGEGFGLPVLEALAAGVPLLVGADTAAADVAGAHAAAVDPRAVDALHAGLLQLLAGQPTEAQAAAGRAHAASFTWARCAAQTRRVYSAAIEEVACSS